MTTVQTQQPESLGQPKPIGAYGTTYQKFRSTVAADRTYDVEDAAFALVRFEGGKSLELATSWALIQPPQQQGNLVRMFGDKAAVDVYTKDGATIYRDFNERGDSKSSVLKPPRVVSHPALMRHFAPSHARHMRMIWPCLKPRPTVPWLPTKSTVPLPWIY